ncbi:MAG: ABC transporter permease [Trueperaceae bacterium]|nr:ABC transporter permease [Trueperaceae bacterium]MCO5174428.1 ABC transporter permease [Trueperaceae bacterium]MCW5819918.1 ABC transporter permease [Trueperaceae bacterium]
MTRTNLSRNPWRTAWRRLSRNRTAVVGLFLLAAIILACLSAPLWFDYQRDVVGVNVSQRLRIPAEGRPLGTDELGRNLLARILWGGRISLTIGIGAVVLAGLAATLIGTTAASYGGRTDSLLMRALDVLLAIPAMLLMITFVTIMAPTQTNLMLAIGLSFVPGMARLVRAQVLSVKDLEYVAAVRAQGASTARVLVAHVLPNAMGPVIASFVMYIPGGIMTISGLGFIGLGIQPPTPEWGAMLASGRAYIRDAWHITTLPGLAIVLTIIALTLVGDGLRDAIDSRMSDR